ncbi:hypothetical protein A1OO_08550 [Enterovibrio norvegicus FF-33]|uniref:hypothetical protein n=1 Tax=Enterovibrio norvegicus TaxID=188144 RepID=UPI0003140775|nr:hypothetical protein [Enterovibrio norvegicus]OEE65848.1 hypothetical protein A1OO_08550 [Enterovibrio norvegicus FF-33]
MFSAKETYQFYRDDSVMTFDEFQSLFDQGVITQEEYDTRHALMMEVVEGNVEKEREWRNHELVLTDRLMPADATYNGALIKASTYEQDIAAYRQRLRDYDFRLSPRPLRPAWYEG